MPDAPKLPNRTIFGARLIWRNFAGRKQQFNDEGNRNFCVILEPALAEEMEKEGWNVKTQKVRDEGDVPDRYITVKVNFNSERPPKIYLVNGDKKLPLGPDEVAVLDFSDLSNVDLTLNPYQYDFNGNQGVTAYLKSLYATQDLDELELKYGFDTQGALPMSTLEDDDADELAAALGEDD